MRKIGLVVLWLSAQLVWAEEVIEPVRVGVLLPFQTDMVKRDKSMDRFTDFYTGALIAVYEMQQTGQRVELYTYDTGKGVAEMSQVLANPILDSLDMIVGPVYPAQVRRMAVWTSEHHVRALLPFTYDVPELGTNPYLLQFNPSEVREAEAMVNALRRNEDSVRFVFVEAQEVNIPTSVQNLLQCVQTDAFDYVYTTVGQIMADSLVEVLSDSVENILVMNTERYANVRAVMPYLMRAAQGKRLTLLTRYAWQNEAIALPQLYTTMFRENVDVDSLAYGTLYSNFVMKERVRLRPCYDLLGYDMMTYVLETVVDLKAAETDEEKEHIIERRFSGLQSDMHFVRVDSIGGFQNSDIHIMRSE